MALTCKGSEEMTRASASAEDILVVIVLIFEDANDSLAYR